MKATQQTLNGMPVAYFQAQLAEDPQPRQVVAAAVDPDGLVIGSVQGALLVQIMHGRILQGADDRPFYAGPAGDSYVSQNALRVIVGNGWAVLGPEDSTYRLTEPWGWRAAEAWRARKRKQEKVSAYRRKQKIEGAS